MFPIQKVSIDGLVWRTSLLTLSDSTSSSRITRLAPYLTDIQEKHSGVSHYYNELFFRLMHLIFAHLLLKMIARNMFFEADPYLSLNKL